MMFEVPDVDEKDLKFSDKTMESPLLKYFYEYRKVRAEIKEAMKGNIYIISQQVQKHLESLEKWEMIKEIGSFIIFFKYKIKHFKQSNQFHCLKLLILQI